MNANQRFAELAGINLFPHKPISEECGAFYTCSGCNYQDDNQEGIIRHCFMNNASPDFSDNIAVIRVMRTRPDWPEFLESIGGYYEPPDTSVGLMEVAEDVPVNLLLTPGLLRDKAVEFMEGKG